MISSRYFPSYLQLGLFGATGINVRSACTEGACIRGAYIGGAYIRSTYIRSAYVGDVYIRDTYTWIACTGKIDIIECLGIYLQLS